MSDYKWSVRISPLLGVPMYDYDVKSDLPAEFHPWDSYTEKLMDLINLIKENFTQYYFSKILNITNDQIEDIQRLSDLHAHRLKSIFLNKSVADEHSMNDEYQLLSEKVRYFMKNLMIQILPDTILSTE